MGRSEEISVRRGNDPAAVERILRALPGWFPEEELILDYVADAARLDGYLAVADVGTVGVALVDRRYESTVELALLAVDPAYHGQGVGSALLRRIESDLRSAGVHVLEVHTLGPSCHDECYRRTREFYEARGFAPLGDLMASWYGPTYLLVKEMAPG